MRTISRLLAVVAITGMTLAVSGGAANADASDPEGVDGGVVPCTLGYVDTLRNNPYNLLDLPTVYPSVSTGGTGNYVLRIFSSSVGYSNCVIYG